MDQADGDAVAWATGLAEDRGVIVSTVLGTDYQITSNVPTESHAIDLANATGGTVSREPLGTMVQGIQAVLRNACRARREVLCGGGDAGVADASPVLDASSDAGISLSDAATAVDATAPGADDASFTPVDAASTLDANTAGGVGSGVEAGVAGSPAGGANAGGQGGTSGSQNNGSDAAVAGRNGAPVEGGVTVEPGSGALADASTGDAAAAGSGDTSGCACGVTGRSSDLRGLALWALGVVFTARRRRSW
jgi:hypothetical protein